MDKQRLTRKTNLITYTIGKIVENLDTRSKEGYERKELEGRSLELCVAFDIAENET